MNNPAKHKVPTEPLSLAKEGETLRMLRGCLQPKNNPPVLRCPAAPSEAVKHFSDAIELAKKQGTDYVWAIAHRGATYRQLRQWKKALDDLEYAINKSPNYAWAYAQRGETYRLKMLGPFPLVDLDEAHKAIGDFSKAISIDTKFSWAYAHRGSTYCSLGDYYQLSSQPDPEQARKYYELAKEDLLKAIDLTDYYAWAYANLWASYLNLDQPEKAEEAMERAKYLDPNIFLYPNYQKGMLYYLVGQYDKAIECFQQDLNEDSDNALALYGIALAQVRKQSLKNAQTDIDRVRNVLENVLHRQTDDSQKADAIMANYKLGGLAFIENKDKEALEYFQAASQLRDEAVKEAESAKLPLTGDLVFLANHDLRWLGLHKEPHFQVFISQLSNA
jgi:tetratricopeptide (TPR) repeat protein